MLKPTCQPKDPKHSDIGQEPWSIVVSSWALRWHGEDIIKVIQVCLDILWQHLTSSPQTLWYRHVPIIVPKIYWCLSWGSGFISGLAGKCIPWSKMSCWPHELLLCVRHVVLRDINLSMRYTFSLQVYLSDPGDRHKVIKIGFPNHQSLQFRANTWIKLSQKWTWGRECGLENVETTVGGGV